jgi:eukaryotic-like serine/threonine-protein kinase
MTAERWSRVEELFHSAVALSPPERESYLHGACNGDDDLRSQVESLLDSDANPRAILEEGPPLPLPTELTPGFTLGPYRVEGKLGEGGMGVVYRASDTRLGRSVAIKMLQHGIGSDPQSVERFAREARSISALNHPHICSLFDVGEQNGMHYLVMEFVEGETLAARLKRGALSTEQVLRYGKEIAEALAGAHARGIIHRDLKPDNVALTPSGAKLLDFGLAKLAGTSAAEQKTITASRVIAGTPGYMAPEQAEGRECDARTDIYALGIVLREMATGKRTRSGRTGGPTPVEPPQLALVIERCLALEPEDRWHSAADVRLLLELPATPNQQAATHGRWPWVAGACAVIAVAFAVLWLRRPEPPTVPAIRLTTSPPTAQSRQVNPGPFPNLALSPDAKKLAIVTCEEAQFPSLWVRDLQTDSLRRLESASFPAILFWSPDSEYLGYVTYSPTRSRKLMKIHHTGGFPQMLAEGDFVGAGTWASDGSILIGVRRKGIVRVFPERDRTPSQLTESPEVQQDVVDHSHPVLLPGEDRFLYLSRHPDSSNDAVYIQAVGGSISKRLMISRTAVAFSPPGQLLFVRSNTLFAQPLNLRTLELEGSPVSLGNGVLVGSGLTSASLAAFSASTNGNLAYIESVRTPTLQLVWQDRKGNRVGNIGEQEAMIEVALSPDQHSAAVELIVGEGGERRAVKLVNLDTGASSQLNFGSQGSMVDPVWSPDSKRIAVGANDGETKEIRVVDLSTNSPSVIYSDPTIKFLDAWSADGRYIFYHNSNGGNFALPLFGDRKPIVLQNQQRTDLTWDQVTPSPDGKWIAFNYGSPSEVFIATFPGVTQRRQVSVGGGVQPQWSRSGNELLYLNPQGKLMSVTMTKGNSGSSLEPGVPTPLCDVGVFSPGWSQYQLSSNGQRILTMAPVSDTPSWHINFVLNWPSLLKPR